MIAHRLEERKKRKVVEEFWLKKLAGDLPEVRLPSFGTLKEAAHGNDTFSMVLPAPTAAQLKKVSKNSDTGLYILFFAALNIVVFRYSGNEDLVIGTLPPASGKQGEEVLFCRTDLNRHMTMRDTINRVRQVIPEAFLHSGYSFVEMVRKLEIANPGCRRGLFNIAFIYDKLQKRNDLLKQFELIFVLCETGSSLSLNVEYDSSLYPEDMIRRFCRSVLQVIAFIPEKLDCEIGRLDILNDEEKEQLLVDFNRTETAYPRDKTIPRLFEEQVERTPHNTAVIGTDRELSPGKNPSFYYKELNEKANRLAYVLRGKGVGTDIPVALLLDRSMHMIVAILAVLKAGGAYLPIEPGCPLPRMAYMLKDTGARLLLTEVACIEKIPGLDIDVLNIEDEEIYSGKSGNPGIVAHPTDLAYIIYTSGTTGKPKGTLTTHTNVVRVVKSTNYIEITGADRILQLSNYAFDGSVFDIYGALLNGAALIMISREDVLSVDRLSELIRQQKITVFFVTTALFNALVDIRIDCFAGVRKVLFGGERVSLEHTKKAVDYLGEHRVIHVYGPTETTVYASYFPVEQLDEFSETVPIGKPLANTTAYILDVYGKPVPVGVTGEIYIGGEGTARGYLNNPELTAEKFPTCVDNYPKQKFCSNIFKSLAPGRVADDRKLYKTGDWARWLPDGNIEFMGRIDQQVKIRGFRIEPGEIEARLLAMPVVKEAVVTVRGEEKGEKVLCAYIVTGQAASLPGKETGKPEPDQTHVAAAVKADLSAELPAYMVPAYFVFLDKIPLTPNGKVDRKALPEPRRTVSVNYVPPRDEIEKQLVEIWSATLGVETGKTGIGDNFFDSGGHSLKGTVLAAKVQKAFNVKVSLARIFEFPTIRKLACFVRETSGDRYSGIIAVEKKHHYNLSFNQKRLWFIYRRDSRSPAFNMPGFIELSHAVDADCLKKALFELCRRHDSMRTGFTTAVDEPVQFIVPHLADLPFPEIDISQLRESEKKKELDRLFMDESRRLFDLGRAPLFRSLLIKSADDRYVFMFVMHHIISDGWSLELFKNELIRIYEGVRTGQPADLQPLRHQYRDFSEWHNRLTADKEASGKSHRFWKQKIEPGIPQLRLPANMDADSLDMKGSLYRFMICPELQENLKKLSRESNTTLFMVMFALYIMVLCRYSNQEEIACSIISAGREHESLHPVIGFFVNSVLFTIRVITGEGFTDFLKRVSDNAAQCFAHQNYPLEIVCQEMKKRYPDIPVAFNMANLPGERETRCLDSYEPGHGGKSQDVKFDLETYVFEYRNGIDTMWAYKKSMFSALMIEYFVRDYVKLLEFFTEYPHKNYMDFKTVCQKKKITLTKK